MMFPSLMYLTQSGSSEGTHHPVAGQCSPAKELVPIYESCRGILFIFFLHRQVVELERVKRLNRIIKTLRLPTFLQLAGHFEALERSCVNVMRASHTSSVVPATALAGLCQTAESKRASGCDLPRVLERLHMLGFSVS